MRLSLAVAFAVVPAIAAADTIKPTAPTWCGSYKADPTDTMTGYLDQYAKEGLSEQFVETLAKSSCNKPTDPARQQLTAKWRQKVSDYLHLSDAENRDYLAAALDKSMAEPVRTLCNSMFEASPTLEVKARTKAVGTLLGCTAWEDATTWWVDDGPEPDILLRAAWVRHMLQLDGSRDTKGIDGPYSMAAYALASHDVRNLQRGDLVAQLDKMGVTGKAKLAALVAFGEIQSRADEITAYYRDKAKTNPTLAKVLFEVPDAAWAEWMTEAATWKTALDDEREVSEAFWHGSKDVLAKCSTKMRKHLGDYIVAKHATTQQQALDAATDAIGYRLSTAAMLCDAATGEMTAFAIQKALTAAKLRRGPRLHVYHALLALGDTVHGFDPKYLGYLDTKAQTQLLGAVPRIDFLWSEPKGVIASLVRDKSGNFTVTFKTNRWAEAIWNCVQTHRIEKIESSGQIIYAQDCTPTGKFKTATSTEKPVTVDKAHGDALKVGQFVMFVGNATAKRAGPVTAYANADQKKLVSIFGLKI
jgi:hypothetical protein